MQKHTNQQHGVKLSRWSTPSAASYTEHAAQLWKPVKVQTFFQERRYVRYFTVQEQQQQQQQQHRRESAAELAETAEEYEEEEIVDDRIAMAQFVYTTGCRRAAMSKYMDGVATSCRQLQEKAEAEAEEEEEVEAEVDVVARCDNSMQKRRALQDAPPLPPQLPQNLDASLQSYRISVRRASGIADRRRCRTLSKRVTPFGFSSATSAGLLLPAMQMDNL
jgi:hypothetical protein